MKKFILVFVLFFLSVLFAAFFINAYLKIKNYDQNRESERNQEVATEMTVDIPSKYFDYSKDEYEKALTEKRVLVLFFVSNWCSECLKQDGIVRAVLNNLTKEGVVGLKSHILDSETTIETAALAKKFNVVKENTILILDKNGALSFRHTGEINEDDLRAKILEVVGK